MKKTLSFIFILVTLLSLSPIDNAYAKKQSCYQYLAGCNNRCEDIFSAYNPGRYGCYAGCEIAWALC